jgi:hypothetical protein
MVNIYPLNLLKEKMNQLTDGIGMHHFLLASLITKDCISVPIKFSEQMTKAIVGK